MLYEHSKYCDSLDLGTIPDSHTVYLLLFQECLWLEHALWNVFFFFFLTPPNFSDTSLTFLRPPSSGQETCCVGQEHTADLEAKHNLRQGEKGNPGSAGHALLHSGNSLAPPKAISFLAQVDLVMKVTGCMPDGRVEGGSGSYEVCSSINMALHKIFVHPQRYAFDFWVCSCKAWVEPWKGSH